MLKVWLLLLVLCSSAVAPAQNRKIEISPYAGGYFSAGFQTFHTVQVLPAPAVRETRPVDEPNSGIFGVRASYDLDRRFALEGAFGFSPAGLSSRVEDFLRAYVAPTGAVFSRFEFFQGRDTFNYSANLLFHWRKGKGWTPFITSGLGAITRTAEIQGSLNPPGFVFVPPTPGIPGPTTLVSIVSVPTPSQTDFSVNVGGGIKRYFTDRCGIRLDVRNYTSEVGSDTVNNLEVSLGLIFKM